MYDAQEGNQEDNWLSSQSCRGGSIWKEEIIATVICLVILAMASTGKQNRKTTINLQWQQKTINLHQSVGNKTINSNNNGKCGMKWHATISGSRKKATKTINQCWHKEKSDQPGLRCKGRLIDLFIYFPCHRSTATNAIAWLFLFDANSATCHRNTSTSTICCFHHYHPLLLSLLLLSPLVNCWVFM